MSALLLVAAAFVLLSGDDDAPSTPKTFGDEFAGPGGAHAVAVPYNPAPPAEPAPVGTQTLNGGGETVVPAGGSAVLQAPVADLGELPVELYVVGCVSSRPTTLQGPDFFRAKCGDVWRVRWNGSTVTSVDVLVHNGKGCASSGTGGGRYLDMSWPPGLGDSGCVGSSRISEPVAFVVDASQGHGGRVRLFARITITGWDGPRLFKWSARGRPTPP